MYTSILTQPFRIFFRESKVLHEVVGNEPLFPTRRTGSGKMDLTHASRAPNTQIHTLLHRSRSPSIHDIPNYLVSRLGVTLPARFRYKASPVARWTEVRRTGQTANVVLPSSSA